MTTREAENLAWAIFNIEGERDLYQSFCDRIYRKRGAEEHRERFVLAAKRITALRRGEIGARRAKRPHDQRLRSWRMRRAVALAEGAYINWDEHGSARGEYRNTDPLDYVPAHEAKGAPYFDMGGEGIGLVSVTRKTVYAKSSKWMPSTATALFLVGKNEVGTCFAHPVASAKEAFPSAVQTPSVRGALEWIWQGHQDDIVQRQGDIALISGPGPKIPDLPPGHVVDMEAGVVRHATHPDLPLPGKGQRIIVGRRAVPRVIEGTRD